MVLVRPVLFSLLTAFSVAAAEAQGPSADAFFGRGVQLQKAGDTVGAIEAYETAVKLDPQRFDALSNLGAAYVQLGRYDEGIVQYRKALEVAPQLTAVRLNLALALYKSARIPEAAGELRRVLEADPTHRRALLLLADCQLQMGNDTDVVALLQPHDDEFANDRLFAYLMGTALINRSELQRGQEYIARLFKDGESAEARLLMGAAQMGAGRPGDAMPELKRALELDPKLPGVHTVYARVLRALGRQDESAEHFRIALEQNPNDFEANLHLGLYLKDGNKLDEAYSHLARANRLRPDDPSGLYAFGSVQLALGHLSEAQALLESVVAKVPAYQQAHVLLATTYYRQKQKDLGDREQAIALKLRAEAQKSEAGASDALGPAYKGEPAAPPSPTPEEHKP